MTEHQLYQDKRFLPNVGDILTVKIVKPMGHGHNSKTRPVAKCFHESKLTGLTAFLSYCPEVSLSIGDVIEAEVVEVHSSFVQVKAIRRLKQVDQEKGFTGNSAEQRAIPVPV